jgi:phospholipid N-methyltransferase
MLQQGQEGAAWVAEQLPLGPQMLEVGCGSGSVTRRILDRQVEQYSKNKKTYSSFFILGHKKKVFLKLFTPAKFQNKVSSGVCLKFCF